MIDIRLRGRVSAKELDEKVGKILTDADCDALLTGPAYVRKPDGKPLCVYLPGAMRLQCTDDVYAILHSLRTVTTDNRGLAGGTRRAEIPGQTRSRAMPVASAIIGAFDPSGAYKYCRLTAWTGQNLPQWRQLQPFLQQVAAKLQQYVPDRYAAQAARADAASPEWVVPGTPFSTVTVNNSWPTGVHVDKGDLEEGFSTIACMRRGDYTGGVLIFPEFRVGVDMHEGDLLLMQAHDWHGNTAMVCACGTRMNGCCKDCGAERISVVSYLRSNVPDCGTPEQEVRKAAALRARKV